MSYVSITIASLSVISFQVGNIQFAIFLALVIAAAWFFDTKFSFWENIFGDGGAYALGHLLVFGNHSN